MFSLLPDCNIQCILSSWVLDISHSTCNSQINKNQLLSCHERCSRSELLRSPLPLPFEHWAYSYVPWSLIHAILGTEPRVSYMKKVLSTESHSPALRDYIEKYILLYHLLTVWAQCSFLEIGSLVLYPRLAWNLQQSSCLSRLELGHQVLLTAF